MRDVKSLDIRILVIGVAVLAAACGGGPHALGPNDDRIIIENDAAVLGQRMHYVGDRVLDVGPVANVTVAGGANPAQLEGIELHLRAEVDPPELDGIVLQATHVALNHPKAYVSYNVQGPVYRGAVDAFFIGQIDHPELASQALFRDTDVSALDVSEDRLYLATATGDEGFVSPAVLEVIALEHRLLTNESRRVDLPSFAGTGVAVLDDEVFVTSGTGGPQVGGLSVLDRESLDVLWFDEFLDARAVDVSWDNVAALSGTPGGLRIYDRAGVMRMSTATGGNNAPESKSTIQVTRELGILSAGDEGLEVVRLSNGELVSHIPVPVVEGVAPEDAVTNAASVSGDLIFIANGGAGLFVARSSVHLETALSSDPEIELVGQVHFPAGTSVNYVASKGDILFVATGTGGLKIVEICRDDSAPVSP